MYKPTGQAAQGLSVIGARNSAINAVTSIAQIRIAAQTGLSIATGSHVTPMASDTARAGRMAVHSTGRFSPNTALAINHR